MLKLDKCIEIDAPAEQVFAYLVDPAHHPQWDPPVDEVKDIQRLPDGRSTYTSVGKLLGVPLEWQEAQLEVIPSERIVLATHATGLNATTTFRLEALEDGRTSMRFVSEILLHGPGPLARFGESLMAKYMDHGLERSFATVKARLEAGIPTGATR